MRNYVSNIFNEPRRLIASIITVLLACGLLLLLVMYDLNSELSGFVATGGTYLQKKIWILESLILFTLVCMIIFLFVLSYLLSHRSKQPIHQSVPKIIQHKETSIHQVATTISLILEEQKRIEEELRSKEEWLRTTLNSMPHAVLTTDGTGRVTYMNPMAEDMTGWRKDEAEGKPVTEVYLIRPEESNVELINPLQLAKEKAKEKIRQYILQSKLGRELWILCSIAPLRSGRGESLGVVIAFQDHTDQKQNEKQMSYEANFDELTGLPNRRHLQKKFQGLISANLYNNRNIAIMFLDLDRFKSVNDSFGHEMGDSLLKSVAIRLQNIISKEDFISRLAGDEFVIILHDITKPQAVGVAQRILDTMKEPFSLRGKNLMITPSIGISLYPEHGTQLDELLDRADHAMYIAKRNGKNNYHVYENPEKISS
ncbi:diguanylate cyclase [Ammoniphilus sp. CFH 90114]|uniref:diguanylate cyclase domain-containing protein n=1 Tax=Ammoniphilus sp. CFH 90114 TaxID=2493665 RepID=UPI00100EAD58|nr:diguanylate cyclase [Ammoniphilus sp. CFH 90114]RXT06292.1 diguanylate cyclase [Ammoniphilus sp. CFH 90114]